MLYLTGIIISLFLLLLICTKKNLQRNDYILATWIIVACFNLTAFYFRIENIYQGYAKFMIFSFTLPILYPILLYAYIKESLGNHVKIKVLIYFSIPFILSNLIFLKTYLLPGSVVDTILQQEGKGYEVYVRINYLLILLSGLWFLTKSYFLIRDFKKKTPLDNGLKNNISWYYRLIALITLIWILAIFPLDERYIYGGFVFLVIWIGLTGIHRLLFTNSTNTQPNFLNISDSQEETTKYKKSNLSTEQVENIQQNLRELLIKEKKYKDPELTLDSLSEFIEVHPNYLSEVINRMEGKNFSEYINELRIEEFLDQANNPNNSRFTLLSIAYDCGFNSKASFHRNFKKIKGMTPKQFIELEKKDT